MVQTIDRNEASKRKWTPFRAIVALLLAISLLIVLSPVAIFGAYVAYWSLVPVYSASTKIAELDADLTLRFYYTWDENTDHGRYLYINVPTGKIEIAMTAFDWAHNSRTSIYVTPERKIAVLGPMDDDYLISLNPPTTKVAIGPSEDWSYMGAFDFQIEEGGGRSLRFVSAAEQAECIPMRLEGPFDDGVRKTARQRDCDHFYVQRQRTE